MRKNKSGFTLIEVMIAAAMLGGLALLGLQLTKQTTKSSSKYQFDTEINLITNEIIEVLSDPPRCLSTFRSGAANVVSPLSINNKYFTLGSGSAPGNGYGNGGVNISGYTYSATAYPSNSAVLNITFQNKNILKGESGPATITRKINLYIEQDATGLILNCRSLSSASADVWTRGTGANIYYNLGKVGIGSTVPAAKLDVAGEAKIGNSGLVCNATSAGAMRYNAGVMEFCNGTVWAAIGGGGIQISIYKCPSGCAGCSGGAWGSYSCQGQYTSQSSCTTIEYPCSVTCACPYIGKMNLSP